MLIYNIIGPPCSGKQAWAETVIGTLQQQCPDHDYFLLPSPEKLVPGTVCSEKGILTDGNEFVTRQLFWLEVLRVYFRLKLEKRDKPLVIVLVGGPIQEFFLRIIQCSNQSVEQLVTSLTPLLNANQINSTKTTIQENQDLTMFPENLRISIQMLLDLVFIMYEKALMDADSKPYIRIQIVPEDLELKRRDQVNPIIIETLKTVIPLSQNQDIKWSLSKSELLNQKMIKMVMCQKPQIINHQLMLLLGQLEAKIKTIFDCGNIVNHPYQAARDSILQYQSESLTTVFNTKELQFHEFIKRGIILVEKDVSDINTNEGLKESLETFNIKVAREYLEYVSSVLGPNYQPGDYCKVTYGGLIRRIIEIIDEVKQCKPSIMIQNTGMIIEDVTG